MQARAPIVKDLVLLGGGHTHVEVLRSFGMKPVAGVRVILVTRDVHTPYSGMLPGYISGFYTHDDCHIDLAKLTSFAKARLINAEATGLDIKNRQILFHNRPPVAYDVLSIDIGITPAAQTVPGAAQYCVPVKPIDKFVTHFEALLQRHAATGKALKVVIVGGGAGGVEIALSMQYRLEQERQRLGLPDSCKAQVSLICRDKVLKSHISYARNSFVKILKQKGVALYENCAVQRVEPDAVVYTRRVNGSTDKTPSSSLSGSVEQGGAGAEEKLAFDECLWCTQASAAPWIKAAGLPTDAQGFILINEYLQSAGGPSEVFAAGDIASSAVHPRPKAGVFAVRQGPPLTDNLRRFLSGDRLQPFVPQSTFLSLITTGDKYCVGTKGWLGFQGAGLWYWKDSIDRAFMRKYSNMLEKMMDDMMSAGGGQARAGTNTSGGSAELAAITASGSEALALLAASKMRCGGCGSKVGAPVLSRVLAKLKQISSSGGDGAACPIEVIAGLDSPDDAAIIRPPPPGKVLVQTLDFFRSFWDDPYLFGQIAANHALGDIWAMGGQPCTALALAVVPLMSDKATEEELTALMAGANKVLSSSGCQIVGGHTSEGSETSLGFSITGMVDEDRVLRKAGLQPGQALVLTKGLGTGAIMAGHMRLKTKGRWVINALHSMCQSSEAAMKVLTQHGATAATDVTGFGLVGHLVEMTRPAKVDVSLDWKALPVLPGAAEVLQQGVTSSIHTQNAKASSAISNFDQVVEQHPATWPILVDPQTAGGLLAGVPQDQADACVQALKDAGYDHAAVIGKVEAASSSGTPSIAIKL